MAPSLVVRQVSFVIVKGVGESEVGQVCIDQLFAFPGVAPLASKHDFQVFVGTGQGDTAPSNSRKRSRDLR